MNSTVTEDYKSALFKERFFMKTSNPLMLKHIAVLFLIAVVSSTGFSQTIYNVPGDFDTISEAVEYNPAGTECIIYLSEDEYLEVDPVALYNETVTITPSGENRPSIDGRFTYWWGGGWEYANLHFIDIGYLSYSLSNEVIALGEGNFSITTTDGAQTEFFGRCLFTASFTPPPNEKWTRSFDHVHFTDPNCSAIDVVRAPAVCNNQELIITESEFTNCQTNPGNILAIIMLFSPISKAYPKINLSTLTPANTMMDCPVR